MKFTAAADSTVTSVMSLAEDGCITVMNVGSTHTSSMSNDNDGSGNDGNKEEDNENDGR